MLKCYDSVTDRVGTQPDIRNETISQHAVSHPEEYDVVCAFPTIEHVTDPLGFARPRNLHETRRTSLCCGAEPRFGNNRDSEFRAECAAASSQLVERGCGAGASRPSRSADQKRLKPYPSPLTPSSTGWDVARPSWSGTGTFEPIGSCTAHSLGAGFSAGPAMRCSVCQRQPSPRPCC